mgnify:CR=1 FL=1
MKHKRPIPSNFNLDTARPPYPNHPYFSEAKTHPFRFRATGFDLVNAWWLIEASTLAYSDPDFVEKRFRDVAMEVKSFSKGNTQCYVAFNDDTAIVAFRGTESRGLNEGTVRPDFANVLADLKTDTDIELVHSHQGGDVHEGFKKALELIWDDLEGFL